MTRFKRAAVVVVLVVVGQTGLSSATYTASSDNLQAVGAAADFGVHVSVNDPLAPLRATETIAATATETGGGTITQVVIQRSPAGAGTWTAICTRNATPWACAFDTTAVTDGEYDFRAIATNGNGYSRTSAVLADQLVDNAAPSVTVDDPGLWFGGTIALGSNAGDTGGSGVADVRYEYKPSSGSTWSTACTGTVPPEHSCNFNTASLTDGQGYDFRAIATDVAGNWTTSIAVTGRKPDNTAPNVATLTAPNTNLSGTVPLSGTAGDAHSGVASVRMQYSNAGANTWSDACVDTTTPFASCSWDTALLNGLFDLRAVVTDVAGNTLSSSVVADRRVDNTPPSTSLSDPGTLIGTEVLTATATDNTGGTGVKNVQIQWSPAGAGTWTTLCIDPTSAPYSCSWNTTAVADGSYDLRSVATDNLDNSAPSAILTRTVDNPPRAFDVQTTNAGTAGRMETGDTITFTYNSPIAPASILAGWDGSGSASVRVRVANAGANDTLTVYNSTGITLLGLTSATGVRLGADHMSGPDVNFTSTMTRSGSTFTITLGTRTSGNVPLVAAAGTMTWNPSTLALDLLGIACLATAVTESGAADANF